MRDVGAGPTLRRFLRRLPRRGRHVSLLHWERSLLFRTPRASAARAARTEPGEPRLQVGGRAPSQAVALGRKQPLRNRLFKCISYSYDKCAGVARSTRRTARAGVARARQSLVTVASESGSGNSGMLKYRFKKGFFYEKLKGNLVFFESVLPHTPNVIIGESKL